MYLQKDITSPSLLMDSWIRFSCVDCLCVPKGMKMCMCNIYKKIALPSEFTQTVRLLEPAAFKKNSKAVTLIREKMLCSSLWIIIIIIILGFIYSVGLLFRILEMPHFVWSIMCTHQNHLAKKFPTELWTQVCEYLNLQVSLSERWSIYFP